MYELKPDTMGVLRQQFELPEFKSQDECEKSLLGALLDNKDVAATLVALQSLVFDREKTQHHMYFFVKTLVVLWSMVVLGAVSLGFRGRKAFYWLREFQKTKETRKKQRDPRAQFCEFKDPGCERLSSQLNPEDTLSYLLYGLRRLTWNELQQNGDELPTLVERGLGELISQQPEVLRRRVIWRKRHTMNAAPACALISAIPLLFG